MGWSRREIGVMLFISDSNGNSFGIGGVCPTGMVGIVVFDGERVIFEDACSALLAPFRGAFG
jgi:hypothetical protein